MQCDAEVAFPRRCMDDSSLSILEVVVQEFRAILAMMQAQQRS